MRLLHTADWHLGLQLHGVDLLDYQEQIVRAIAELAQREKADALLLSGDVFDRVQAAPEAIALYDEAMALFVNDLGLPVYLIAGNHDAAPRLGSLRSVLRRLHFHVAGRLDPFAPPLLTDECAFFLLPHFGADEARYYFPGRELPGMAAAMEAVLQGFLQSPVGDRRRVLLAHCFAAGGEAAGSDRSALVGGSARTPVSAFEGFDYVALGHLHGPQTLGGFVRYAGSPLPYSFAESGQAKSCTLYDTKDGSLRVLPLPAPYELVEKSGPAEALLELARQQRGSEAFWSLTLTDRAVDHALERELRECLPHLLLLRGRAVRAGSVELGPEALSALSPLALVQRYLREVEDEELDEEESAWFRQAMEEGGERNAPA